MKGCAMPDQDEIRPRRGFNFLLATFTGLSVPDYVFLDSGHLRIGGST
jgi:hypothetical protein